MSYAAQDALACRYRADTTSIDAMTTNQIEGLIVAIICLGAFITVKYLQHVRKGKR